MKPYHSLQMSILSHGVFFSGGSFFGVLRGGAGSGEKSPGPGIRFSPRHFTPCGEKLDFFLANPAPAGKILTFFSPWRGIGSFLCILARNLYFWRGICMFW